MTGAKILIECLLEQGVDTIFGYPGGTILNVYDELYRYEDKIKHYLTAHEQGASHAADGYARATGKVGVCMATSGPGATNLVTGIATAYMDSVPLVAITCNVAEHMIGRDSFQEIDITGVTMPITKHNYIISDVAKLADSVREAFDIARSGRPGPVLIDITKNVTWEECDYAPQKPKEAERTMVSGREDLDKAAGMIEASEKPFIMSGGGVISSNAMQELLIFAKKTRAPVSTTLMGIGSFPASSDQYTGLCGMHGTKASNLGVMSCDLLIVVGARFSDRVTSDFSTFAKGSKILHIDIDPAEINKNIQVDMHILGDAKLVLQELNSRISERENGRWLSQIQRWKEEFPYKDSGSVGTLNPQFIMQQIYDKTEGSAIITTEVGQNQLWAAQFYKFDLPHCFLTSGGLGTMGYGTGASIGAAVGRPDKQVVAIAGDGCFRMNCNELATISYYGLPVVIVIMNNHTLGMVRQWQTLIYEKRYSQTSLDRAPNFKKLAEAYGIAGYEVNSKAEFEAALGEALSSGKPAVIDANIDIDDMVLPIVLPGRPLEDLISSV